MTGKYLLACLRAAPSLAVYNAIHVALFPQMKQVIRAAAKTKRCLLDLGCGSAIYSLSAAGMNQDIRIIGIDAQPERIKGARRIAAQSGLVQTEFRVGDIRDELFFDERSAHRADSATKNMPQNITLPANQSIHEADTVTLRGEFPDTVLLCDLLCYYPFDEQTNLLTAIARKLRPGGRLLLKDHMQQNGWRNRMLVREENTGRRVRSLLHTESDTAYYGHGLWIPAEEERVRQLEQLGLTVTPVPVLAGSILPHSFLIGVKK